MADVMIYRGQGKSELHGQLQGHATECKRGMAQPGPASLLSLTLREFLTAGPLELMRRLDENVDRFFEGRSWRTSVMTLWSPSVAISEEDGHIKVCAELPGLNEDDVRVELTQDKLTISGERKRDWREGMDSLERLCGLFTRTIPIPYEAQVEKVTATFENEILTVLVPVLPNSGQSQRLWARIPGAALEKAQALN
jgi:HSP20 family protein